MYHLFQVVNEDQDVYIYIYYHISLQKFFNLEDQLTKNI
jgi:hypothetical protein